ncbi:myotubularin-related protein 10 [Lampris incognitus]|uniref:myotubularin-related protein 10 n=1 Tax=Lampris incognitus TaxID=2546036 RepID=UPI0024B57826|nr:myotubularin-related protein 10 [Lampris incognitus]
MFSEKRLKPTFKSYLPPLQKTIQPPIKKLEAKLLPGEIVVNEVNFVRKCISAESSKDDLWGKLICTNFKVSFVTHDAPSKQRFQIAHRLLGEHDIPLTCLEQVVTVNDSKGKKKVLGSNKKLKFNPAELILYCKDLRIVRFCFDEAGPDSAKKVCLAIGHYSHPADPQLLFGFEYLGRRYHASSGDRVNGSILGGGSQTPLFDRPAELDREIKRTGAAEWRVCSVNEGYAISPSLPEHFVVPVSLADQDLKQFSCFFTEKRIPIWCWNHNNGSALIRMASISNQMHQRRVYQRICAAITKSHPQRGDVHSLDLDKSLPNIQDIQSAFVKIRQVCVIDSFEETEEKWLSSVESSQWLEYVRAFLKQSAEVVYLLDGKNASVVLQEEEDRDLNCVVSSLVQLMLDPHYRSLVGFQSLVQKEWVMAGHRFLDRCNHLKKNDKEECPLFQLFLDCVWQMMRQYPVAFEFTETYLVVLSDSMWVPVFSTFLFNCPQQHAEHLLEFAKSKRIAVGEEEVLRFPPVWEWSQQFSLRDQALFNNPMYVGKGATCVQNGAVKSFRRTKHKSHSSTLRGMPAELRNGLTPTQGTLSRRNSLMAQLKPDFLQLREEVESPSERFFRDWFSRPADQQGLLLPLLLPSHLTVWKLYFLRWVPESCIPGGGPVTAYHKLSQLADEIETLQSRLRQYKGPTPAGTPLPSPGGPPSEPSKMYFKAGSPREPPTTPEYLCSSFPFTPVGNLCRRSSFGTPISKFLNGAKIWLSTETLASETL